MTNFAVRIIKFAMSVGIRQKQAGQHKPGDVSKT